MPSQSFGKRWLAAALCGFAVTALAGCLGPTGLRKTRGEYNAAIQTTNDEDLLLNLVRLRYSEGPLFVRVTGVTAQFEADATANVVGGLSGAVPNGAGEALGTGLLGFADRPTISFDTHQGPEYTHALLTRLDLDTLFLLPAAGFDAERILRIFVENINGVDNASSASGPIPAVAPEYAQYQVLAHQLSQLRGQQLIALDQEDAYKKGPAPAPTFDRPNLADTVEAKKAGYELLPQAGASTYVLAEPVKAHGIRVSPAANDTPEWAEATKTLRLNPQEFYEMELAPTGQLKPAPCGELNSKLTMTNRSLLQALFFLSHNVAAPEEHVRAGVVTVTRFPDGSPFDWDQVVGDMFRVCVARCKPNRAAVAVKYRGYWYYIDDADVASKATLASLEQVIRLQRGGVVEGAPVLTLSAGR